MPLVPWSRLQGSRRTPGGGLGTFAQIEGWERLPTATLGFFSDHLPSPPPSVRRLPLRRDSLPCP